MGSFGHLHGFIHDCCLGHSFEELDLVNPKAQYGRHLGVKTLHGLPGNLSDLEVQLAAPAQNAHHEFSRQSPVRFFER
jgi:hypothetical protein